MDFWTQKDNDDVKFHKTPMQVFTKRLLPGEDLRQEIETLVKTERTPAGTLLSAVGSLIQANLRLADGKTVQTWREPLEIVGATGTLSPDGCHIHLSIANQRGEVFGGHLKEGCLVHTTVELILLSLDGIQFTRTRDSKTGYDELLIS